MKTMFAQLNPSDIVLAVFAVKICMILFRRGKRAVPVYLIDFAVAVPADDLLLTKKEFMEFAASFPTTTEETIAFQARILESNGLGELTAVPRREFAARCIATLEILTEAPSSDPEGARHVCGGCSERVS
jgi:hypothetical protein